MKRTKFLLKSGYLIGLLSLGMTNPGSAQISPNPFPLGSQDLPETRVVEQVAEGLRVYTVSRGVVHSQPLEWVLTAGAARSGRERQNAVKCLAEAGVVSRFEQFETPGNSPRRYVEVVGGMFASEEAANRVTGNAHLCKLKAQSVAASPKFARAAWRLKIVELRPGDFSGRLYSALASGTVIGREKTSAAARREAALVGINGGFFSMKPEEGVVGEPAGIAIIDGSFKSEPTRGRPYLVLNDTSPVSAQVIVATPSSPLVRWSDGSSTILSGVDRNPGQVRDCGTHGPRTNHLPAQDVTCYVKDDLVAITQNAGFVPTLTNATAVVVTKAGQLRSTATGDLGNGEMLLVAIGKPATALRAKAKSGARADVDLRYVRPDRNQWSDRVYAVNGAPTLLHDGKIVRNDDREGWATRGVTLSEFNYIHRWIVLRNPRTAAGVTADGTIYFVTVDGREYAESSSVDAVGSVGLSIDELRAVMAHLGVKDAINLDGGGSTALAVRGQLASKPSDPEGERPVGDVILIGPRKSALEKQ